MKDYAGGDTGLILGVAAEACDQVIELDRANPEMRDEFEVNARAETGGKGGVGAGGDGSVGSTNRDGERAGDDGLMGATKENVGEGGDARGQGDFRPKEIGVLVSAAGIATDGRAVMAAEISGDTKEGKKTIGGGELPAVEVLPVGDKRWDRRRGTEDWSHAGDDFLSNGDGRSEIGIAAENDKFVLSGKRGRGKGQQYKFKENRGESEHEVTS